MLSVKIAFDKTLYQLVLSRSCLHTQLVSANIQYYASLVDYYDVYELRKKLKSEQTSIFIFCVISLRYLQLNDNLMDAFS